MVNKHLIFGRDVLTAWQNADRSREIPNGFSTRASGRIGNKRNSAQKGPEGSKGVYPQDRPFSSSTQNKPNANCRSAEAPTCSQQTLARRWPYRRPTSRDSDRKQGERRIERFGQHANSAKQSQSRLCLLLTFRIAASARRLLLPCPNPLLLPASPRGGNVVPGGKLSSQVSHGDFLVHAPAITEWHHAQKSNGRENLAMRRY